MRPFSTLATALLCSAALFLSGCSGAGQDNLDSTRWTITQIYVDPQDPALMPTRAGIAFGIHSAVINTGCAPVRATMQLRDDVVEFGNLEVADLGQDQGTAASAPCEGVAKVTHDTLMRLLEQPMTVKRPSDHELSLTVKDDSRVDNPIIRLVSEVL